MSSRGLYSVTFITDLDSESATLVEANEISRLFAAHLDSTVKVDCLQFYVRCQQNTNTTALRERKLRQEFPD